MRLSRNLATKPCRRIFADLPVCVAKCESPAPSETQLEQGICLKLAFASLQEGHVQPTAAESQELLNTCRQDTQNFVTICKICTPTAQPESSVINDPQVIVDMRDHDTEQASEWSQGTETADTGLDSIIKPLNPIGLPDLHFSMQFQRRMRSQMPFIAAKVSLPCSPFFVKLSNRIAALRQRMFQFLTSVLNTQP